MKGIRIFIGTSPGKDDEKAEKALEYSLRKHSSEELEIVYMRNDDRLSNFFSGFKADDWWTPFSYLRWAIPEYCNFEGRAVYMDVDQLNFRDISELAGMDLQGKAAATRPGGRTCVMVMDCDKMKGLVPPVEEIRANPGNVHQMMSKKIAANSVEYDARWNCLDGEGRRASDIWHLHFTDMATQPWAPAWTKETHAAHGVQYKHKPHPRPDLVYIWEHVYKESIR